MKKIKMSCPYSQLIFANQILPKIMNFSPKKNPLRAILRTINITESVYRKNKICKNPSHNDFHAHCANVYLSTIAAALQLICYNFFSLNINLHLQMEIAKVFKIACLKAFKIFIAFPTKRELSFYFFDFGHFNDIVK